MITQDKIKSLRENGRIDVVRLANEFDIKVKPMDGLMTPFVSESGYIQYKDGVFVIYVNPTHSVQRQRFSVAHELGHFAKHIDDIKEKGRVDRSSANSLDKYKEKEADEFAANLLVPKDDLKKYIEENNLNSDKLMTKKVIEKLAVRYDVSLYAMITRLRECDYYVPYIDIFS